MIAEVINLCCQCCEHNDKVYLAFGTLCGQRNATLLYYNIGITGQTWRLIRDWYINMKEFVVEEGKSSRIYEVKQGTR